MVVPPWKIKLLNDAGTEIDILLEVVRMKFEYLYLTRLVIRAMSSALLTLVTLALLLAVWASFFLWGVHFTEKFMTQVGIISPLLFKIGRWQLGSQALGGTEIIPYLAALSIVLISQLLYFYRIPRTHHRLTTTWEFVITTFLFISSHLCLWNLFKLLSLSQIEISPELNLAVTLLMLNGLFWLQGFGLVTLAKPHYSQSAQSAV